MHDIVSFAIVAISSLLVIINPLMVTSVFIALTTGYPPGARGQVARKTSLIASVSFFARGAPRWQKCASMKDAAQSPSSRELVAPAGVTLAAALRQQFPE